MTDWSKPTGFKEKFHNKILRLSINAPMYRIILIDSMLCLTYLFIENQPNRAAKKQIMKNNNEKSNCDKN